ncbi:MAG: PspC domain-containing protein [Alistipes sp.]|jgi:phage shock protein PspC (stress-responsive transcriptional regulator)|nr:PspC domain-containing protein [Alistipes sp.]
MKQTFSVNIGGRAYNIDADAYALLDRYLNDISSRLSDSDVESMEDIESRIADIFDERISSSMLVVNVEMVRRAMAIIGRPEMFGGQKRGFSYQESGSYPHEPRRLFRSRNSKVIGGVCGGLGEYFDIDPNVIRLISVLLVFFGGLSLWVYIVMWIVLPQSPCYVK